MQYFIENILLNNEDIQLKSFVKYDIFSAFLWTGGFNLRVWLFYHQPERTTANFLSSFLWIVSNIVQVSSCNPPRCFRTKIYKVNSMQRKLKSCPRRRVVSWIIICSPEYKHTGPLCPMYTCSADTRPLISTILYTW